MRGERAVPRRLPLRVAAVALVLAALAGCSSGGAPRPAADASAASAAPSSSAPTPVTTAKPVPALVPLSLAPVDEATATTETTRIADAIQALIPSSELVYVDDHGQYSAASGENAAFYGIARVISLQPEDDPRAMAASLIQSLEASGWTVTQSTDQAGLTLTALTTATKGQQWLTLIGSDTTVEGQSVLNLQLASPDLP